MPRKPRELEDEALYHVFNRGNDRRNLFQESADFQAFLQELFKAKTKFQASLYHYCLMTNHYHLLLQIPKGGDLPRLMHQAQLSYARYFKKKYGFIGHLFQERYRSPRIPEESYYLQCGRYIERNPVKAFLAKHPGDYPHTSFHYYAGGRSDDLLEPSPAFLALSDDEEERRKMYAHYVTETRIQEEMAERGLLVV